MMLKSNKILFLLLLFFFSCNLKNGTEKSLKQHNKIRIFSDSLELFKNHNNQKKDTFIDCNELQGIWKMYEYIPTIQDKQKLDTTINLRINNCILVKTKFGNVIDSALLLLKLRYPRHLYYWQNEEGRYIQYMPNSDTLFLNKKGFDGAIECYKRIKRL